MANFLPRQLGIPSWHPMPTASRTGGVRSRVSAARRDRGGGAGAPAPRRVHTTWAPGQSPRLYQ